MSLVDLRTRKTPRGTVVLYHGSSCMDIEKFDIQYSRDYLDFGVGMYFTTNREQAMLWSITKSRFGAVYEVEIDLDQVDLKQFLRYDNEFINTFCLCRAGFEPDANAIKGYNAIYGYMIDNDRAAIVKSTNDYVIGKATEAEVRNSIRVFESKDQLCIKEQWILDQMQIKWKGITEKVDGFPRGDRRSVKWKK